MIATSYYSKLVMS